MTDYSEDRLSRMRGYIAQKQAEYARANGKPSKLYSKYVRMTEEGQSPVPEIIKDAESAGVAREKIDKFIADVKYNGDWWEDAQAVDEAMGTVRQIYRRKRIESGSADITEVVDTHFDKQRDADLIAHALFIDPEVRKEFGDRIENLYRAVIRYRWDRVRSGDKPKPYQNESDAPAKSGAVLSLGLEKLIEALPSHVFAKDDEHYTSLRRIIRKKASRDALPHFKNDPDEGIAFLEKAIANTTNENIKFVYGDVLNHYRNYVSFQFAGENKNFRDPATGKTGTFPSLHQRVGAYHALDKQRFGILDGCGTGKTAIGALMYPLVQQKKAKEGKKVHNRVLVVGTIPCLKTWKAGFEGGDQSRYLADRKKVVVVNGHAKDDKLLVELKGAEVVFANYQQLSTNFNLKGQKVPVYKVLSELGYDLVVFDEVHNIKNRKDTTAAGKETHSYAARYLATQDRDAYVLLLSGTPMPDNLRDYAMIYHLLRPDDCKSPEAFVETIDKISHNPHMLATFVDENTLRRTSEEVNNLIEIDKDNWHDDVPLTPAQRAIHDYLVAHRPLGWLMEARKALLDPCLVDPLVLEKVGLLGKVGLADATKYCRLEELVNGVDGPLAQGEKFVVFSSVLKEGITKDAEKIAETYRRKGKEAALSALDLSQNLASVIGAAVKSKYGKNKKVAVIDGNVSLYQREALANRFKSDSDLVGIICTTETGGESLDFSHATHAYFLDEDYSPATTEQAIARLWRRGQTKEVKVKFLRGYDTIDDCITDYVEQKRLAIKIALDGHPPTKEELELLSDQGEHTRLKQMILARFGGLSVDVSAYKDFELSDVVVKNGRSPASREGAACPGSGIETTRAQQIAMRIGKDKNCWFDPEFAKQYAEALPEMAPYFLNRVRVLDLLRRAKEGEITFPEKVLALAAGPSILYNAYSVMTPIIKSQGFTVPKVHDLDFSKHMQSHGGNPVKLLADVREIPALPKTYGAIDHGSVSLLQTPKDVLKSLQESNRVLKDGGLLELSVKSLYFKDGFYDALRQLSFEPLTPAHTSFALSRNARRRLSEQFGPGFAEACASKISDSHFILARKTGEPGEVKKLDDLWFLTERGKEYVPSNRAGEEPVEISNEWQPPQKKRKARTRPKKHDDGPAYNRAYEVSKDGTVRVLREERHKNGGAQ
jgi:superfamily II DNA or RNA helicase